MSLSIVLPTINESGNIALIITQIQTHFGSELQQIIVVDDNSIDDTCLLVEKMINSDHRINLIQRANPDGLTGAIRDGFKFSNAEYVAWMDCDGSMPVKDLKNMWDIINRDKYLVVVGSRFVQGGMVKGKLDKNNSIFDIYKNLKLSEDSFVAVLLSKLMNILLKAILNCKVKDLTSGFIIIQRKIITHNDFKGNYGEYFPILIRTLEDRKIQIKEVGYINLPRFSGESKTGTNLIKILKRGYPYLILSIKFKIKRKSI